MQYIYIHSTAEDIWVGLVYDHMHSVAMNILVHARSYFKNLMQNFIIALILFTWKIVHFQVSQDFWSSDTLFLFH